ncbi:MAG: hypothetical protein GXO93_06035 [FCB group bacterium]|nr:hypothetical protein [FCB group bacterium]
MVNKKLISIVILINLVTVGCGVYTFKPKGKSEIKSIAIERFQNKTSEYGLADQLTDEVTDAIIADGSMEVVTPDKAEAILTGILTRYERKPYKYDENDQVETYAVYMYFDIALKKSTDGSDIWRENMNQIGVYRVADETEEDGRQKAIALLVQDIINKTTKSW